MQKVSDLVDVEAPCEEVFAVVANIERRMQLSPLWGLGLLLEVTDNYPQAGSRYRVRVTDAPFGMAGASSQFLQSAFAGLMQVISWKIGAASRVDDGGAPVSDAESHADESPPRKSAVDREQEYVVAEYEPPHRFGYYLNADCKTIVTWRFQSIPRGTRIHYEEIFCDENLGGEDFLPTVRRVIREWLANIKRYSELRGGRGRLFAKWLLDRFFLRLRPDQRRTVLVILFMQGIFLAIFVVAAIGLGIAGLLF
ncbi:MAG: hypothetical protein ACOYZ6_10320 [Chloroflexota bacterium]